MGLDWSGYASDPVLDDADWTDLVIENFKPRPYRAPIYVPMLKPTLLQSFEEGVTTMTHLKKWLLTIDKESVFTVREARDGMFKLTGVERANNRVHQMLLRAAKEGVVQREDLYRYRYTPSGSAAVRSSCLDDAGSTRERILDLFSVDGSSFTVSEVVAALFAKDGIERPRKRIGEALLRLYRDGQLERESEFGEGRYYYRYSRN